MPDCSLGDLGVRPSIGQVVARVGGLLHGYNTNRGEEAKVAEPAVHGDREVMLKDHTATTELYKILLDIRFKLLTFVPTVTTVAVGVLASNKQQQIVEKGTTLFVGGAGLLMSLAIIVYEIRNSQIHDRAVHRIKHLERLLGFTPSYAGISSRGMYQERGTGNRFIGLFIVQHDRALSVVYGVAVTLWTWLLLTGLTDFVGWFNGQNEWPGTLGKAVISIGVGLTVAAEITRHGGMGREKAITYTLADILPAGIKENATDLNITAGERLWREFTRVHDLVPDAAFKMSLYQLVQDARNKGGSDKDAAYNAEKLVDLAIASGALSVRQRLRPPWQPGRGEKRDEERNRVLKIRKGELPSPAQLCAAIAGGQKVLDHFPQRNEFALNRRRRQEKVIALIRADLISQYGLDAPWCSLEEVRLRWELLTAAAGSRKGPYRRGSPWPTTHL